VSSALLLDRVTKRFGRHLAVDELSLAVPPGSIYGFLGPNGAGKTTTLRMVMSILLPDSGRIEVLGHGDATAVKDRLGYLPEEKGLYKKMKAGEILAYFARLKGLSRREAWQRARELLSRHGLGDWTNQRCEALSKGMGQKVQILGTLIHEPELVILDEPFSGLDPVNAEIVQHLIVDMKRQGRTVIFSTHVMAQAEQICDSALIIDHGRKVLDDSVPALRRAGGRAIRLDYDGDGSVLASLPGIAHVNDAGKSAELFLDDGADPQDVLAALVGRVSVRRFDLTEPSLHEIFVRAVGGRPDVAGDDAAGDDAAGDNAAGDNAAGDNAAGNARAATEGVTP
jgi:ABC-2 type transport system ATP-binding protein